MKECVVKVVHADGRIESLRLRIGYAEVRDGELLNCIVGADGTEHFFTPDGYYDGSGRAV